MRSLRSVLAFLATATLCAGVAAQLNDVVGAADLAHLVGVASATLAAPASAGEAYHAAQVIAVAQGVSAAHKAPAGACKALGGLEASATQSVVGAAQLLLARRALKCEGAASAALTRAAAAGLESAQLEEMYFAVSAADALGSAGLGVPVPHAAIVGRVADLRLTDGTFRPAPGVAGSARAAGYALQTLATLYPSVQGQKASEDRVKRAVDGIDALVQTATGSEETTLTLGAGGDKVAATSLVLGGILRLGAATGAEAALSPEQLAAFAQSLLAHKTTRDVEAAAFLLQAAAALAGSGGAGPVLAVRLARSTVSATAKEASARQLAVVVSDVFGRATKQALEVKLSAATRRGYARALELGQTLAAASTAESGEYVLDLGRVRDLQVAGAYQLELHVAKKGGAPIPGLAALTRPLRVTSRLVVGDLTAVVSSSSKAAATTAAAAADASSRATAAFPRPLSSALKASDGQYVHLLFSLAAEASGSDAGASTVPIAPHQVFLHLRNPTTGGHAYVLATPKKAGGKNKKADADADDDDAATAAAAAAAAADTAFTTYRVALNVGDRAALQGVADGGVLEAEIVVGDVSLEAPVVWSLGRFELATPAKVGPAPVPLYTKTLLYDSDTTLAALPEIEHRFRAPDARPPAIVSLAVSGVIVAALLAMVAANSVHFAGAAKRSLPSLWILAFFGCLAAVLAVIALYFFALPTMFHALGYLGLLAAPTIFTGHRLLSAVNAADDKKDKSD